MARSHDDDPTDIQTSMCIFLGLQVRIVADIIRPWRRQLQDMPSG